jgi:L-malate glycosyltransferase
MTSEKVRLFKFLNFFCIGGTERQFVNLVKRLDPSRFDVGIGCFQKIGPFLADIEACGRPVTVFQIKSMLSCEALRRQLQFARFLRQSRIQVLHTYGWWANVFGIPAAKLARVPVTIASIRDMGAHLTPMQCRIQQAVCRLADCVLVNSDSVRDWLLMQRYSSKKIRVIRNGIEEPSANNAAKPVNVREEYGVPPEAPLIATICRLNRVKAVNDLLDAAALVIKEHPAARFMIIGDGPDREALMEQAQRSSISSRVIFTGFRSDTAQILPQLTISVLSSLTEGLSNTLLESMGAGVPVVATRVGGNTEIVAEGITGLLVPPRDPISLKQAICRVLEDPVLAARMGSAGRQRIHRQFSVDNTVRETETLYLDLLQQ